MKSRHAASVSDYRDLARRRLPRILFDYVDGGSYAEITLNRNIADLAALSLRQRVMRDMSEIDLSTELFGDSLAMPVILGPVGFAGMLSRRGEVQAARAAHAAGIPFTLSTVGICSVDEVASGAGKPPWFQLYMTKDRGHLREVLARAERAGGRVLVMTVDLPTLGARYRDLRSGMGRELGWSASFARAFAGLSHPSWTINVYLRGRPHHFGSLAGSVPAGRSFASAWEWIRRNFDPSVTWKELNFIRDNWSGAIVIKGVMTVEDARAAADAQVDGLVVSNHGGRQLDGVRSTASALPAIVAAVGDRLTVLPDGGARSGLDVLRMLASGARACLLGRAWAYALAADGNRGVTHMLATIREELRAGMVLTGCRDAASASTELLDGA